MKLTIVAGARPNFIKVAPIIHAIKEVNKNSEKIAYRLVHTGQHYDKIMSDTFFQELDIPKPDINLGSGSGTQAEQTAAIMLAFEKDLMQHPTDIVMVVGDVNSTMACAIVAKKLQTHVAHVEGGIRSRDLSMPEEINRIVTDSISDYFFTTSIQAGLNLKAEGVKEEQIFFVGNTMIDTLIRLKNFFIQPNAWKELGLEPKKYLLLTLHRPSNVDDIEVLRNILEAIAESSNGVNIVFPAHPRTQKQLLLIEPLQQVFRKIQPLGYLHFNFLVENSLGVITDSGGITEEATIMDVPCITLRSNTERPETVEIGTNELVGNNPDKIRDAVKRLTTKKWKKGQVPEKWDGKAAQRIVQELIKLNSKH